MMSIEAALGVLLCAAPVLSQSEERDSSLWNGPDNGTAAGTVAVDVFAGLLPCLLLLAFANKLRSKHLREGLLKEPVCKGGGDDDLVIRVGDQVVFYDLVGASLAGLALVLGLGATLSPSIYKLYCPGDPDDKANYDGVSPVWKYGVWSIQTDGWPDDTDGRLTQFNQCYQDPDDGSACARSLSAKCWTIKLANIIALGCNTAVVMPYFFYDSVPNSIFAVQGLIASFFYLLCFSISAAIKNNEPSADWDCGFPGHGPLADLMANGDNEGLPVPTWITSDRYNSTTCSELHFGEAYRLFVVAWLFCGAGGVILYFNGPNRCLATMDCCEFEHPTAPALDEHKLAIRATRPVSPARTVAYDRTDPSIACTPTKPAASASGAPPAYAANMPAGLSASTNDDTFVDDMFNADGTFK